MFTIKFYSEEPGSPAASYRQRIVAAESFTILRDDEGAEITIHFNDIASERVDIGPRIKPREEGRPPIYAKAIIENAAGKTTEIISAAPPRYSSSATTAFPVAI